MSIRILWLCVLLVAFGFPALQAAEPAALDIRIVPGDWGSASREDIHAVCLSAAGEIVQHCGDRQLEPMSVRFDKAGPMVVYGLGESGERRILLQTRDTHWSQLAYQFSHELAHVLCNYREAPRENLWFEESLCETASLFALRSMAKQWQVKPPYSNWKGYAKSLEKYADDRISTAKRAEGETLAAWYGKHAAALRKDPTNRELNQVVAVELLKLLESHPEHWQALAHLNQWSKEKPLTFAEYLQDWHSRVPEKHRAFVADIATLFEIDCKP